MTQQDAIKLIGLTVESKSGRRYTVRDVTNERDGSHNVLLSGGQVVALDDFDGLYQAVQNA